MVGGCELGLASAYTSTISWRSETMPLPMEIDPRAVFERLFGASARTDPRARLDRREALAHDENNRAMPSAADRRLSGDHVGFGVSVGGGGCRRPGTGSDYHRPGDGREWRRSARRDGDGGVCPVPVEVYLAEIKRPCRDRGSSCGLNVYDALNINTVLSVSTLAGSTFRRPTSIVPPRIAELGVTYTF